MKKLSICLLTAATTLAAAGAIPATAYAATGTYNIPGGKVVVIGGTMNGANCDQILPGINLPGIQFPGVNIPGSNVPDNSLPLPEFPIPDQPGNMLPDQPGDTTPDQPETDGSQDAFANQVVKLVNEERAKAGLSPLTVNSKAANAA
ncbi:MAG: CAP domain-containing protein, partial [Clostridium sp.]|nr:CAP domain-containing protein [Clostridium sp.]